MDILFGVLWIVASIVTLIVLCSFQMAALYLFNLDHQKQHYSGTWLGVISIAMVIAAFPLSQSFADKVLLLFGEVTPPEQLFPISGARSIQLCLGTFSVLAMALIIRSHKERFSTASDGS